jgi:hypothetical protein
MVRAGIDPDLIGRTAAALAEREPVKVVDEQAERRRAADRERKRLRNSAESAEAPRPPALDKETPPTPPKEINPTPLTPQTSLSAGRDGDDLARLSERLCDAADGKIQPQSAIVVGPILEMLAQGVDLETDVLPAIAAASKRLTSPAKLTYFLGPIRDAYNRRIEAGKGLSKPKPSAVKRPEDMTDDERRTRLAKFLNMARGSGIWLTWMHGPPPGHEGCRVPADLLEPRDLRIDWMEEKHPETA